MSEQIIHQDSTRRDPFFYGSEQWWAWRKVKAYLTADDVPQSGRGREHSRWRWAKKEYVWRVECGGMDDIAYVYYLKGGPRDLPASPQVDVSENGVTLETIICWLFFLLLAVSAACVPALLIISCVTTDGSHIQAVWLGYTAFTLLMSFMGACIIQSVLRIFFA